MAKVSNPDGVIIREHFMGEIMMHDFLLTVKYRDDPELSERHMTREDAFAKANNLDVGEIEWAEVSDPDGVMLWDHISGEL